MAKSKTNDEDAEMRNELLEVIVVGGSLAGLMHGIILKRLGHNVTVLEQSPSSIRQGQDAGIGCGPLVVQFCEKCGIDANLLGLPCKGSQVVDKDMQLRGLYVGPRYVTAWSLFYHALRAHFDGFTSEQCPYPVPTPRAEDGKASYFVARRVVNVVQGPGDRLSVLYNDLEGDAEEKLLEADILIVADGANSTVRRLIWPNTTRPYAGYVAWRGTVPEAKLSKETRDLFTGQRSDRTWLWLTSSSTCMIVYMIPSDTGSMEPGGRIINYVWYSPLPSSSSLFRENMTDTSGVLHRNTLPRGKIQPANWKRQVDFGDSLPLAPPLSELVHKTDVPFITAISDVDPPSFPLPTAHILSSANASNNTIDLNSRIFVVGEAYALIRPHAGASTDQAAYQALNLEKVLKEEMSAEEWNMRVHQFAQLYGNWSKLIAARVFLGRTEKLRSLMAFSLSFIRQKWYDRVGYGKTGVRFAQGAAILALCVMLPLWRFRK